MNAVISNGILTATASTRGAELIGLKKGGREVLWSGDPAVWGFHAPILFPICGGLKDDKFLYSGKEYTLQKHGYVRTTEFEIESKTDASVTFLHRFDDATLKSYPFRYEFRVIYTLSGSDLRVDYRVKNLSEGEMLFSVGAHEGFACPGGIEDYSVLFETAENLDSTILVGNLLARETRDLGQGVTELPLKYEYFAVDAQVFLNLRSRSVTLLNRKTGDRVGLDFPDHGAFLLWTKPGANYICLEPWCGCPDFVDSDGRLEHKEMMIRLNRKEETTRSHTIRL